MSILKLSANNNLLDYDVRTTPDPLHVSPQQGNPSPATLTIVVSNGTTDPIYCNQITFSFDIGPLAQDLTNQAQGIRVSASPSDQWQIAVTSDGVFTATPVKPKYNEITANGLVFHIDITQVNQKVGTFAFTVQELSSKDNKTFSQHTNVYKLAKFPHGFFVRNFTAKVPQVEDGKTVTLRWLGSDDAKYTLLYADSSGQKSVDVTNVRSWESQPLHDTTTFILHASAQSQGETVDTYLSTTVTVADPEITATSLTVLQSSALQGGKIEIGPGSYVANTDGFVIGRVNIPSDPATVSLAWIWGSTPDLLLQATGGNVCLMTREEKTSPIGPVNRYYGYYGPHPSNFTMPVKKGEPWSVGVHYDPINESKPSVSFFWIPFGTTAKGETVQKAPESEAAKLPKAPKPVTSREIILRVEGRSVDLMTESQRADGDPSGYVWEGIHLFFRGSDSCIYEFLSKNGKEWTCKNLSAAAGGAPPPIGSLACYVQGKGQHIFYRGADDSHIHQLFGNSESGWGFDLFTTVIDPLTKAKWVALAASSDPLAYFQGDRHHLFYVATDQHVHELNYLGGPDWEHGDLNVAAGGAPAAAGDLTGYWMGNTQHIFYRAADDSHIHQLYGSSESGWKQFNPTGGVALPASSDPLAYVQDKTHHLFYVATDQHVHELNYLGGPDWEHRDLNVAAGGAPAAAGDLTGCVTNSSQHLFYLTIEGDICELSSYGGSEWHCNLNLTAGGAATPAGRPVALVFENMPLVFFRGTDGHIHGLYRPRSP